MSSPGLEPNELANIYVQQGTAQNQLWATFVLATFTGAAFATQAGQAGGLVLLAAGAIGFSAFAIGHGFLIFSGLTLKRQAADDIRHFLESESIPPDQQKALRYIGGDPVSRWGSMTCHIIIDGCVLLAFYDRALVASAHP